MRSATLDFRFRVINTDDGLSSNQVNSIYKDHKGFLWIGTRSGLNRYDGYTIKAFKHTPSDSTSLIDNFVRKIVGDENDNLWILSPNSKLCIYDPVKDVFYHNLKDYDHDIAIPHNIISDINMGSNGKVLISNEFFGVYIYDINKRSSVWLKNEYGNVHSISSNSVSSIKEDSDGFYWIVNKQGVIEKIDSKTYEVVQRKAIFSDLIDENGENFRLFIDRSNDVWVYSESNSFGTACYSSLNGTIQRFTEDGGDYHIVNNVVKDIVQDSLGMVWIGMDHGGINVFDKKTNKLSLIENVRGEANTLPENSIISLFMDNTGIIWVGMYKGGLAYYHPDFFKFKLFYNNPFDNKSISSNDINAFAEDDKNNIWIGSNGGGLIYYDRKKHDFTTYKNDLNNKNSLSKDVIISLLNDSKDRLWIGTYFGGLNVYENGKFVRYLHDSEDVNSLSNNRVWSIFEDSRHNIWIGTLGGGVDFYVPEENGFVHYKHGELHSVGSNFIFSIEEDKNGNVWFGTINGIDVLDWDSQRFHRIEKQSSVPNSLSDSKVIVIEKDSRGFMWVGTTDGLNLYDESSNTFRVFRQSDGLVDNSILGIEEDDFGHMWIMTTQGLSEICLDDASNVWDLKCAFQNYDKKDGLEKQHFNERASLKTSDGELLFGGSNGFNLINPLNVKMHYPDKNVMLLQFKLFDNVLKVNEKVSNRVVLTKTFQATKEITLKHDENIFAISFAALDFYYPAKLVYEYRLDGFNDKWFRAAANDREATYTNLNPGIYYFRVRVSDDGESWYPNESLLKINILPPVWATRWAYFSYICFILLLLIGWRHFFLKKERLRIIKLHDLEEVNRIAKLNDLKFKFFTNVSHEFRTPLTLIISPVKKLISNTTDPSQIKQLEIIERNGKRLLNLVNQLLDFRKLEVDQLRLCVSSGDIVQFVSEKVESFMGYSDNKGVKLVFETKIASFDIYFDHDKIEKIIYNLLSNAFKFTLKGGVVKVTVSIVNDLDIQNNRMVLIQVSDTGIGINPAMLNHIFDRFFQEDHDEEMLNPGSGIGLSLTKEYVELHGGIVKVDSTLGVGSTFSVYIPSDLKSEHENLVQEDGPVVPPLCETESLEGEFVSDTEVHNDKPLLLLVEDNDDLRLYLSENLSEKYRITQACNGKEGLDALSVELPTIIICDVMMPIMNGIDLCKKVKNDDRYSHIPFVLLTAATSLENELKGLEVGADDYITKPFVYSVLELKVSNMIARRKLLHAKFNNTQDISPSEICITSVDQKFFEKSLQVVNENLTDSEFSIDKMCDLIGISRAHLYNKLVAITGKTPAEFIKIMRLKRAAQLLRESQLTVSEISYDVGYNGPRYFTKHFKEFYGKTPSQYAKSIQ